MACLRDHGSKAYRRTFEQLTASLVSCLARPTLRRHGEGRDYCVRTSFYPSIFAMISFLISSFSPKVS